MCRVGLAVLMALAISCFSFDAGKHHIEGPYYLSATDIPEQMALCYKVKDDACVGRVGETVFAAGADERHVIAKRHPSNDRRRIEYFILDRRRDGRLTDPEDSVMGPYTATQFEDARRALGVDPLLDFTVRLRNLE